MDRAALERDEYNFNVNFLLGGQVKGEPPNLILIYPQGNPLQATEDSPYLQIGETKYGRPILDRGIKYDRTTLEEAAKYALLSMDSTMKSNVTVGPPVDLLAYSADELDITRHRRFTEDDPDLTKIRMRWEQALRQAVLRLPNVRLARRPGAARSRSRKRYSWLRATSARATRWRFRRSNRIQCRFAQKTAKVRGRTTAPERVESSPRPIRDQRHPEPAPAAGCISIACHSARWHTPD